MCAVNIRGHEADFYEAEARCHEAEIEAKARKSEAMSLRFRTNFTTISLIFSKNLNVCASSSY